MRPALGQPLVNWLWAFVFFMAGLSMTLSPTPNRTWISAVFRIVMTSVGGAALVACSRDLWLELMTPGFKTSSRAAP